MLHLTPKKLQELSDKWLSGTISADEQRILDEWYNQEPQEIINWESDDINEIGLRERLFAGITKVQTEQTHQYKFLKQHQIRKVAAVIIVALGCSVFWMVKHSKTLFASKPMAAIKIVKAPANKAILTLADGSKVVLDNANNGLIAKEGNTQVHKTDKGELVYSNNGPLKQASPVSQINSVSTATGGQYELSLSDGTKVWLNALSTLKYPAAFSGKERNVELTGEAYFEVEKNKDMPFTVTLANNATIKVLGTHFNIMAYNDEKNVDATLLEGSIDVTKNGVSKMITPGQQAKITDEIKISNVNAGEAIAWKKGLFSFDKADIPTIMRQIGRWYGVEIVYQGKVPLSQITGYIARNSELPEVLKMLQVSGLKTAMDNKKIIVLN